MKSRFAFVVLVALLVVATVLSSCGQPAPAPTATPQPQPTQATGGSGTQPTAVPQPTGFDWRKYEGETVSVILNKHPFSESLIANLGPFEEKTGIRVEFEVLSQSEYWNKIRLELAAGSGAYDVYMIGPGAIWSHVPAGWCEPLDEYLNDPTKTDAEWYKFDDFYPKLVSALRWNGKRGGGAGEGPLYAIPGMVETYILSYRADLFDKWNIKVPTTLEEWHDAMIELQTKEHAENSNFYGTINRGFPDGSSIWSCGFASMMQSYATTERIDFTIDKAKCEYVPAVNQEALIEPTRLYAETMAKAGPPGWTSVTWYDSKDGFTTGNFGTIIDCDFFAYSYEDAAKSPIAGKAKYAIIPHKAGGDPVSNVYIWALGMSPHSKHKDAGWYLIQFATGPEQLLAATRDFSNWVPTRKSVFENPDVLAICSQWGQGTWLPVVKETLDFCELISTPHTQGAVTNDAYIRQIHEIYKGKDAKTALDEAAARIAEAMAKANEKPNADYCK